jgi:small subunit ribosomal protein S5
MLKSNNFRIKNATWVEKVIELKRVTKVVKGGKIMTYRAIVIVGDSTDKVGVGIGCADDASFAITKACTNGRLNIMQVPITKNKSIPHMVRFSYGASIIMLRPTSEGSGLIAGSSIKTVIQFAGIKNISAKQFGSNNILNNAKATVLALSLLKEKIDNIKFQSTDSERFYTKRMKLI